MPVGQGDVEVSCKPAAVEAGVAGSLSRGGVLGGGDGSDGRAARDQAGLKGYQVGGAAISTKHAGFAVNMGGATAEDVKNLLQQVSDKVFENSGIRIEPEVRIW